jgi:glutathione S-transferase
VKLYYTPGSCSLATHIVAREADIAVDLVKVDLATHKTATGDDYTKTNPKGYVPAILLDRGEVLTEAAALLQYLGDLKPQMGLLPPVGTLDRFRVIEWLTFISAELHKGFSPLWDNGAPEATKQAARDRLANRFSYLNRHLAGRLYLTGDAFTVADAYCFTIVSWCNFLKVDLAPYPTLGVYLQRVAARPKVREALTTEGLLK